MRDEPTGPTGSAGNLPAARRSRWPLALSLLLHAAVLVAVVRHDAGWAGGGRGSRGEQPIDVLFPAAAAAATAADGTDRLAHLTPAQRQAERERQAVLDRLVQPTAVPDSVPGAPPTAASATAGGPPAARPAPPAPPAPPAGSGTAGGEGGSVTRPEVVEDSRILPDYPEAAQRAGIEGVVVLKATIDARGLLHDLRVLRGVDPLLDEAALAAVRKWRFRPATRGGRPVQVDYVLTLDFHL
jgi:protein TonB